MPPRSLSRTSRCSARFHSVASDNTSALDRALRVLRCGGVVAHASEGVWGLACDPFNRPAVERVLDVKGRDAAKGLIVVAADSEAFADELDAQQADTAARIRASWPGAVTWVVPNARFPSWITGGRDTVAIRVPDHDQARALAASFGGPIVSTSANRSGEAPAVTAEEVERALGDDVDYVLPGETGTRQGPSRIIDAASGETLR